MQQNDFSLRNLENPARNSLTLGWPQNVNSRRNVAFRVSRIHCASGEPDAYRRSGSKTLLRPEVLGASASSPYTRIRTPSGGRYVPNAYPRSERALREFEADLAPE
jgi:hypothetical protein